MIDTSFGEPDAGAESASPRSSSKPAPGPLARLHILVVDDDQDTREMLRQILTHAGALVTTAADGESALTILRNVSADVVISDLSMPRHDGRWVVRNLRALEGPQGKIPAIAVTAYRETESEADAIAAGFDVYLEKPLDFRRLIDTILRVVKQA
ncbi:MAG TPA: response regulator [Candidatus Acidoferrum sp.]|nr:response regulator [Candidatus Acidoferrum sp.]